MTNDDNKISTKRKDQTAFTYKLAQVRKTMVQDHTSLYPCCPSQICYNSPEIYRGPAAEETVMSPMGWEFVYPRSAAILQMWNTNLSQNLQLMDHPKTCGKDGKYIAPISPRRR